MERVIAEQSSHLYRIRPLFSEEPSDTNFEDDTVTTVYIEPEDDIDQLKANLLKACRSDLSAVPKIVRQLESAAQPTGNIQQNILAGISGDWELLYASDDTTRSSPFFWAFQKAFPDSYNQIFQITDSIPAPLKDIGPAYQTIQYDPATQSGKLVSRVTIKALGGMATSVMTTRASITGVENDHDIQLTIDTTKPEQSSILTTMLGPLGPVVNENAPSFPSGVALERIAPGSSQVVLQTTFCDEGLRISKNKDRPDSQFFVWRRREFASYDFL